MIPLQGKNFVQELDYCITLKMASEKREKPLTDSSESDFIHFLVQHQFETAEIGKSGNKKVTAIFSGERKNPTSENNKS